MHTRDDVARPSDPDLDCDIDGARVVSVTQYDGDFIVTLTGGSGRWATNPGRPMVAIDEVTEMELVFGYAATAPGDLVARIHRLLCRWQDAKTPLRFVSAPGRMSLIMEDDKHMLPIPRGE